MTNRVLARAIIGTVIPNFGDLDTVPEPYRTTVEQARAAQNLLGSPGEPGDVDIPPTPEEPA